MLLHREILPRTRQPGIDRYGSVEKPLAEAPPQQRRVLRSGSPRLSRTLVPATQDVCCRIDDGNCFVRTARDGVRDAEQFHPPAVIVDAPGDGSANDGAGIFLHPKIAGDRAMEDESLTAANCRSPGNPAVERDILVERERALDVAVNCLHFSYSKYPYHIRTGKMPRRKASMPNGTRLRGPGAKRANTVYSVGSQHTAEPFAAEADETGAQYSCTAHPGLPTRLPKTGYFPHADSVPSLRLSCRIILLFPLPVLLFVEFPRDLAAEKLRQTHDGSLGSRRQSRARLGIALFPLRHSDLRGGSGHLA